MNTPLYHNILNKRRESVQDGTIDHIFNGIVVDNPLTELDCTPDNGFDNFEHLVKGDRLVLPLWKDEHRVVPVQSHQ